MMSKIPMTPNGMARLTEEVQHLKSVERPNIIAAIAEARAHGDLRENAEYHAAKERQGWIEARIRDIDAKLSHVQVIDVSKITNHGKVVFGATVTLVDVDTDQEMTYQIVGEDEADLKVQKLSVSSPMARGMIGKEAGDTFEVNTPKGILSYEIIRVEYL
jgi:transcription elongation factor GreA